LYAETTTNKGEKITKCLKLVREYKPYNEFEERFLSSLCGNGIRYLTPKQREVMDRFKRRGYENKHGELSLIYNGWYFQEERGDCGYTRYVCTKGLTTQNKVGSLPY